MKVLVKYEVTHCYHSCPYFRTTMDGMECGHPYFEDKPCYSNMIINHTENILRGFPSKCPLIHKRSIKK